jgi:serine/threonine-protein kinase
MEILPPSKLNPQVPPEIDDLVMTALARDPERRWQVASALRSVLNTVTRRMGLVAHNHDVTAWLAWAFAQPVRQRSGAHALPADVDEVSDVEIDVLAGTGAGRRTAAPIGTPSTPSGPPAGPTTGTPSGPRPAPLPTMVGVGLPSSRTGPVGVPSISGSRPVQPGPATPAATGRDPAFVTGNVQVAAGTAPPAGPPTAPRTASTAAATPTAGRRFGFVLLVALAAGGAAAAVYFALLALT